MEIKSIWAEKLKSERWFFYCPSCCVARAIPMRPKPTFKHYLQIGLTSLVIMIGLWPWLGVKGLIAFLPIASGFEIFYRVRVRAMLACSNCGFDPFLYQVSIPRARQEIENFWRKKYSDRGIPYPEKEGLQPHAVDIKKAEELADTSSVISTDEAPTIKAKAKKNEKPPEPPRTNIQA